VIVYFVLHFVAVFLDFTHGFVGEFELMGEVVDVSFECLDL
jgi:hypothetical protein